MDQWAAAAVRFSYHVSSFYVKTFSAWLTVFPIPRFQVRVVIFLFFLHAKVGRERLVYFNI